MSSTIPFIHIGLGPIGQEVLKIALRRPGLRLVGVVDIDPQKIGKDVGKILGVGALGILVSGTIAEAVGEEKPLIATHTTRSHVLVVMDQLLELADRSINVISSTEELLFPFVRYPRESEILSVAARKGNCTILGTGVNPGFVMDTLPIILTSVCHRIDSIRIERVVDVAQRRESLQRKVGAGLSVVRFRELADSKNLGHVGLQESVYLIARALNWKLDEMLETLDPIVAEEELKTPYLKVSPGQVSGIWHRCSGVMKGEEKITLDLKMYIGATDPQDRILLNADPQVECIFKNGIFGDTATAAILVNLIPRVIEAPPGLKTMLDITVPHYQGKL